MYNRGDVKITFEDGEAYDSENGYEDMPEDTVYLPHRCDSWIVGGKEEVKQLIEDLQWQLDILERD